jgi:predicted MFS family arabinose efflux permease
LLLALQDELWSGITIVGAPGVEAAHGIDHGSYAFFVFTIPLLLAAAIETPVLLHSDRVPRRVVLAGSLGTLCAALLLCAFAPNAWVLALGLTLAGAASGVACAAAEAELVTRHAPDKAMSRWMAFGAAGDVLTPLFVASAIHLGAGYRAALVAVASLAALQAVLCYHHASGDAPRAEDDEARATLREAFATLRERPRLLAWLAAAACCTFLDEIVIAFCALRFEGDLGWSASFVATSLAATSVGSLIGAVATERLLARVPARTLLSGSTMLAASALVVVILTTSPTLAVAGLFCVGMFASPHYPLSMSAAYECAPGRPGLVAAAAQPFVVVDVVFPVLLGMLATRWGVSMALACLLVQPIAVLGVSALVRRR